MKRQPTTQQITWFLDLNRNNQLDLSPPYQRKSVWSTKDRKFFLDTIFRNYPAPPIFIHREVNDKGYTTYHVVDGKQRIETILSFFDNKLSISSNFGDKNLDGKKFKDLNSEYKRLFWDYTLVVDFIDVIEGNNIEEVFDRVNRNAKNLQPQELRHARFNGWFIDYAENEADSEFWWNYKISTKGRDKRMKNIQFISELLMIVLQRKVIGFDQSAIDEIYADYDDLDEKDFDVVEFKETITMIKEKIVCLDNINKVISEYIAGSNINFYSLWAFLFENNNIDNQKLAEKINNFFLEVQNIKNGNTSTNENAKLYYENMVGAATELPQRRSRLEALKKELL